MAGVVASRGCDRFRSGSYGCLSSLRVRGETCTHRAAPTRSIHVDFGAVPLAPPYGVTILAEGEPLTFACRMAGGLRSPELKK